MIDVNPLLSNGKTSYVILDVNPVYMIKNIHQSKYKVIKTKKVLTFISIKSTWTCVILVDVFELSSSDMLRRYFGHN